MLEQRRNGYDKKSAKKTQQGQIHGHVRKRESMPPEQGSQDGHTDGTERDQPVFDLASGKIPCGEATETNANRNRSLEITALLRIGKIEHVFRVDYDEKLNQRREREEVGVADHGQPEHAIFAHQLDLPPQVGHKIETELF